MAKKTRPVPKTKVPGKFKPSIDIKADGAPEKVWQEFWKVLYGGKEPTLEEIKEELAGYYFILSEVPKVYEVITGGMMSKPNYMAEDVLKLYHNHVHNQALELYQEIFDDVKLMATNGKVDLNELADYLEIPKEKRGIDNMVKPMEE